MQDSIYIDLTKDQMKGLELDQEVTVVVTGKVKSLRSPDEHSAEDKKRAKKDGYSLDDNGSMTVDISKIDVSGDNEFSKMVEED